MPIEIEGQKFTGFFGADFDANRLRVLSYAGRVEWLRFRFNLVFLTPFTRLVGLESGDCYIWLCVTNLLCGAIEALTAFEFGGLPMLCFSQFVEKYFSPDWRTPLRLEDLTPGRSPAATPAQHLYKYFRCGLEHSFAIEWGGLRHREEGAPSYLFERTAVGARKSLGIVPRELVADFLAGVEKFFQTAAAWNPGTPEAERFSRRFEQVFLTCETPSP